MLTIAAGVGGGSISTALFLFFFGFQFTEAVALSKATVFIGEATRFVLEMCRRSPIKGEAHKPLIHYEIAMLFLPTMLAGTVVGVVVNMYFPEWILLLFVVLVLL